MFEKYKNYFIVGIASFLLGVLLCGFYIYHISGTAREAQRVADELRKDNQAIRDTTKRLQNELDRERQYYSVLEKSSIERLENVTALERISGESWKLLEGTGNEVQRLGEQNQQFARLIEEIGKTKQDIKD